MPHPPPRSWLDRLCDSGLRPTSVCWECGADVPRPAETLAPTTAVLTPGLPLALCRGCEAVYARRAT